MFCRDIARAKATSRELKSFESFFFSFKAWCVNVKMDHLGLESELRAEQELIVTGLCEEQAEPTDSI